MIKKHTVTEQKEIKFSEESLKVAENLIRRYPVGKQKSAMLPLLHLAQAEFDGWLSVPVMNYVATLLNVKPVEVYEVASFYTMFNLKPVGKCLLEVCHTSPCWLNGADELVQHLQKKLNIKVGETTADGVFTLKTVECLGSCGTAPMLQCGAKYYEKLTHDKMDDLLEEFKRKEKRPTYVDPNR